MRTVELPDEVYAALEKAAQTSGTTPAEWIGRLVVEGNGATRVTEPRTLYDRLKNKIGVIRSAAPACSSENVGETFADYLEQKQREGRL